MPDPARRTAKEEKIRQLRAAIAQLEEELERDLEDEQHRAIDNLDEYLNAVDSKFDNLKLLWEALKDELRKAFGKDRL